MSHAPSGTLTREETAAAFARHTLSRSDRALTPADWEALGDLFAENATHVDAHYGARTGRAAIRRFMHDSMVGFDSWRFPLKWVEVGEGRVVAHYTNRAPGRRRDGSLFEFPSVTIVEYDADGLITLQTDLFDTRAAISTFMAWKVRHFFGFFRRRRADRDLEGGSRQGG